MKVVLLQAEGMSFEPMIMIGLVFLVMYFFMIRPQKKKEKELAKKRDEIKNGDDIITAGGIHGKVMTADTDTVVIAVESQAKLKIEKSSIAVINGIGATGPTKK